MPLKKPKSVYLSKRNLDYLENSSLFWCNEHFADMRVEPDIPKGWQRYVTCPNLIEYRTTRRQCSYYIVVLRETITNEALVKTMLDYARRRQQEHPHYKMILVGAYDDAAVTRYLGSTLDKEYILLNPTHDHEVNVKDELRHKTQNLSKGITFIGVGTLERTFLLPMKHNSIVDMMNARYNPYVRHAESHRFIYHLDQ